MGLEAQRRSRVRPSTSSLCSHTGVGPEEVPLLIATKGGSGPGVEGYGDGRRPTDLGAPQGWVIRGPDQKYSP